MRRLGPALLTACLVSALATSGCSSGPQGAVEIRIHYSRFQPSELTVPRGQPVRFVLRNEDPIDHEWIVGSEEVHRAHRTGTEPVHGARATEVTIPALGTRTTTITFPTSGTLLFICHLPGHEAYGMVGTLEVT